MSDAESVPNVGVGTRPTIEIIDDEIDHELLERAQRIRDRSRELIAALGTDHPLVAEALSRADALEREARSQGRVHLR